MKRSRKIATRISDSEYSLVFDYAPEINRHLKDYYTAIWNKPQKAWHVHVFGAKKRIDFLAYLDRTGFVIKDEPEPMEVPRSDAAQLDLPWEA